MGSGHQHESWDTPGRYKDRARPLGNRDFKDRAFTVGIGGPRRVGIGPHPTIGGPGPEDQPPAPGQGNRFTRTSLKYQTLLASWAWRAMAPPSDEISRPARSFGRVMSGGSV